MSKFIIRFDDICPSMNWNAFRLFEEFFDHNPHFRPLLGVIPDNLDSHLCVDKKRIDFWDKVRRWRDLGWTIAQHGHTHQYLRKDGGILKVGNDSEFAGLSYEQQYEKIARGKEILIHENVWQPYFMAPSHSFDKETITVLKKLEFIALTDGYGVFPYLMDGLIVVPQLFGSTINFGIGVYTICLHINSMSQKQIETILAFMRNNAHRFIPFPQALDIRGSTGLTYAARIICTASLRSVRYFRRIANGL